MAKNTAVTAPKAEEKVRSAKSRRSSNGSSRRPSQTTKATSKTAAMAKEPMTVVEPQCLVGATIRP